MAKNVVGKVLGADPKEFMNVSTVEDVKKKLGLSGSYQASINGEEADLTDELDDYDSVSFAPAVKGGSH